MKNLNDLSNWYENLTKETVENIKDFYDNDAFFKDPFNEVIGRESIKHIFIGMFDELEKPHFIFIDKIKDGNQVFITWNFIFNIKKKVFTIHGSSHLKLNDEQKIIYHRDYWDVGEELLLKLPLVKNIYGILRNKLASAKK